MTYIDIYSAGYRHEARVTLAYQPFNHRGITSAGDLLVVSDRSITLHLHTRTGEEVGSIKLAGLRWVWGVGEVEGGMFQVVEEDADKKFHLQVYKLK